MTAPLSIVHGHFDEYAEGFAAAVERLDSAALALRPAETMWDVRMTVSHVVAVRAWWYWSWMGMGGATLERFVDWDEAPDLESRPAADPAAALRESWAGVRGCLEKLTVDDLERRFQRPVPNAAGERPWRTLGWITWHVAEHDIHHGGEVSVVLGMNGIPTTDL